MKAYHAFLGEVAQVQGSTVGQLHDEIEAKLGIRPERQLVLVAPRGSVLKQEHLSQNAVLHVYDRHFLKSDVEDAFHSADLAGYTGDRFTAIASLKSRIAIIGSSIDLFCAHMSLHNAHLLKGWAKKATVFKQIKQDLDSCKEWETVWTKSQFIEVQLLEYNEIKTCWEKAQTLEASLDVQFVPPVLGEIPRHESVEIDDQVLGRDMMTLKQRLNSVDAETRLEIEEELQKINEEAGVMHSKAVQALVAAQRAMQTTIRAAAQSQTELAAHKTRLSQLSTKLAELDALKTQVAKVLDYPYVYGIALAEKDRREAWKLGMEHETIAAEEQLHALRVEEDARISAWETHYSKLDLVSRLVAQDCKETSDVWAYIDSLRQAGLEDVCDDLKNEVLANLHELEQSFSTKSLSFGRQRGARRLSHGLESLRRCSEDPEQELAGMQKELSEARSELAKLRDEKQREDPGLQEQLGRAQEQLGRAQEELGRAQEEHVKAQEELGQKREELSKANTELTKTRKELDQSRVELTKANKSLAQTRKELTKANEGLVHTRSELTQRLKEQELANEKLVKQHAEAQSVLEKAQAELNTKSEEQEATLAAQEVAKQTNSHQPTPLDDQSHSLIDKTSDLAQRLFANSHNLEQVLEKMGLQTSRKVIDGHINYQVNRVRGLRRSSRDAGMEESKQTTSALPMLNWVQSGNDEGFEQFMHEVYIDNDIFRQAVTDRFGEVERVARKYHSQTKSDRERLRQLERQMRNRLALGQFQVGDLILFLPTRDSDRTPKPWAAFNVNSPHYFLDPSGAPQLGSREFVIGRATKIEQHNVGEGPNPFGLPEGLQWYLVSASWR